MNPLWELLERTAQESAEQEALLEAGQAPWSWSQVLLATQALAARMEGQGAEAGDRVALLADNGPVPFLAAFAAARLGVVLVPLNPRLALGEQEVVLGLAGPRLLLADEAHHVTASSLAQEEAVLFIGPRQAGAPSTGSREAAPARVDREEPAQLYFTSGTTGRPKGVILTHGNLHAHALAAVEALQLTPSDTWGHFAPMFHLADAWSTFAVTAAGGRHAFLPRFEARDCLRVCARDGVTVTNLVPTMLQRVLAAVEDGEDPPHSLRLCLSGGAPIAPAVVQRILSSLGCSYQQTYGLTETSPYLTLSSLREEEQDQPLEDRARRLARTGYPFPSVELRVVDQEGVPVPQDDQAVGEIVVRGPTVSPGYWQDPEATAAAHREGWFHTGDLATIDAKGSVQIVDRLKDLILSGGENVYSIEVEAALLAHPAVLECAVFAVPHPDLGESVAAAVVLRAGRSATKADLQSHCRALIAGYKLPRRLWLLEELPKTGSGKIRKRALREEALGDRLGPES